MANSVSAMHINNYKCYHLTNGGMSIKLYFLE